jgi:hypothetical protein
VVAGVAEHAAAADLALDPVGADPLARRQRVPRAGAGLRLDLAGERGPQALVERAAGAQRGVVFLLLGGRQQPLDRRAQLAVAAAAGTKSRRAAGSSASARLKRASIS